jgi:rhizosphere induced protein
MGRKTAIIPALGPIAGGAKTGNIMATTTLPKYSIRFRNRSGSQHDFVCFQQKPDPSGHTLAWFSRPVPDGVDDTFTWTLTYDFVWMETGPLSSGIEFAAEEVVPADLETANLIGFTVKDGAFQFTKPSDGGAKGSLTIKCDTTIPDNEAVVGIGMAGSPTFATPARPNFADVFTPHPEYWIIFGSYKPGQVLDPAAMATAVQVKFPANVYDVTATLDSKNTWQIEPTPI